MHQCTFIPLLIFWAVSVTSFHLPNLDLTSQVDVDSSKHNSGLINSYLQSNWSQSLNVGSVSVGATIVIIFIIVIIHLRTTEKLNQISKHVEVNSRAISRLGSGESGASRSRGSKAKTQNKSSTSNYAEEKV